MVNVTIYSSTMDPSWETLQPKFFRWSVSTKNRWTEFHPPCLVVQKLWEFLDRLTPRRLRIGYPLVNSHIAMENHQFLVGKSTINGPFSIAMLVYQRVSLEDLDCQAEYSNCGHWDPTSVAIFSTWPLFGTISRNLIGTWLVGGLVSTPLKNDGVRQLGPRWHSQLNGK